MSTKKTDQNIVSLKQKSNESVNQGAILPQIHKLFNKGLRPTILEYYDKLDDALFDLAEKAQNNEKQTHYFEAMREVRKKKELMVRKFSENVQQAFKLFKQGKFNYFNNNPVDQDTTAEGLSLVDERELDQKLAVTQLVEKANSYLHQHLFALEKRFTLLAGGSELKVDQIPVSPAVIVGSFATTFEHLHIDETIHLIMLKLFERSLIKNLVQPDLPIMHLDHLQARTWLNNMTLQTHIHKTAPWSQTISTRPLHLHSTKGMHQVNQAQAQTCLCLMHPLSATH